MPLWIPHVWPLDLKQPHKYEQSHLSWCKTQSKSWQLWFGNTLMNVKSYICVVIWILHHINNIIQRCILAAYLIYLVVCSHATMASSGELKRNWLVNLILSYTNESNFGERYPSHLRISRGQCHKSDGPVPLRTDIKTLRHLGLELTLE